MNLSKIVCVNVYVLCYFLFLFIYTEIDHMSFNLALCFTCDYYIL